MYIVVYSLRQYRPDGSFFEDSDWSTHETLEEAQKEYQALMDEDEIYTASICASICDLDRLNQDL
jgi:hypothetical protein